MHALQLVMLEDWRLAEALSSGHAEASRRGTLHQQQAVLPAVVLGVPPRFHCDHLAAGNQCSSPAA